MLEGLHVEGPPPQSVEVKENGRLRRAQAGVHRADGPVQRVRQQLHGLLYCRAKPVVVPGQDHADGTAPPVPILQKEDLPGPKALLYVGLLDF